jgi:F0F1-type ATP synthase membrane subunit c/vacuolar-type H+-ATPase subunit K
MNIFQKEVLMKKNSAARSAVYADILIILVFTEVYAVVALPIGLAMAVPEVGGGIEIPP